MKNSHNSTMKRQPFLKMGKVRAGRVAQVVEHLPSKHKALHSNPNTAKRKKNG
jgi:hypothetical protein